MPDESIKGDSTEKGPTPFKDVLYYKREIGADLTPEVKYSPKANIRVQAAS